MPSLVSLQAGFVALLLITLTTLRISSAIPLELGEGASSSVQNDFIQDAQSMPIINDNERYASQFQSAQFQNDNQMMDGETSMEELLKKIDEISYISGDEPDSVTENIFNDQQMMIEGLQLSAKKHRDIIELVNPKYVANVNILPITTPYREDERNIDAINSVKQGQGPILNQMHDDSDFNMFKEEREYVFQITPGAQENRMDGNFRPWGLETFGKFDNRPTDNVDEAEKVNVPEQDVGEQETENQHKNEIENIGRNEDEIPHLDIENESMQPANSNNIAYSFSSFAPNHQSAAYSSYIDPSQFRGSGTRISPDMMLQYLKSLGIQIGQSPIMNTLFSLQNVPLRLSDSSPWPSKYEAKTYLPPNSFDRQIYLSPNVAAAQNGGNAYRAPSAAALRNKLQAYVAPNVAALLNEAQNSLPNGAQAYVSPNIAASQNGHKVYVSPNIAALQSGSKAYTAPNFQQANMSPNMDAFQNRPNAYASPNIAALQSGSKAYTAPNLQQANMSPNMDAFQNRPNAYASPNIAALQSGAKAYTAPNLQQANMSPNMVAFQNGPMIYVSPNIAALQSGSKVYTAPNSPIRQNDPRAYVSHNVAHTQNRPNVYTAQNLQSSGHQPYLSPNVAAFKNAPPSNGFPVSNIAAFQNAPNASPQAVIFQNDPQGHIVSILQNGPPPFLPSGEMQDEDDEIVPPDVSQTNPIQGARRATMQVETNDLSPEIIQQLQQYLQQPTRSKYISNVVQESIAQSSADFNDLMRKSFTAPTQQFAQAFDQNKQAFDRGSQYMNNFFNNQLRLPQFPTFPGFPQLQISDFGQFPTFSDERSLDQNFQIQPSRGPYISPNLRPLDVDPTDIDVRMDIRSDSDNGINKPAAFQNNSGSNLIQYGNGNQNVASHSDVSVSDIPEHLGIDADDEITVEGNDSVLNDETDEEADLMAREKVEEDVDYGDPAKLDIVESDAEEASMATIDAEEASMATTIDDDGQKSDIIQTRNQISESSDDLKVMNQMQEGAFETTTVMSTTMAKRNLKPEKFKRPLINNAVEVTTIDPSTPQDEENMLDSETTTTNPSDEQTTDNSLDEVTEISTPSIILEDRLDINTVKSLAG